MVVHQPSATRGAPPLHQVYGATVSLHQHLDWTLLGVARAPDFITRFREVSPSEFDGILLLAASPGGIFWNPCTHPAAIEMRGDPDVARIFDDQNFSVLFGTRAREVAADLAPSRLDLKNDTSGALVGVFPSRCPEEPCVEGRLNLYVNAVALRANLRCEKSRAILVTAETGDVREAGFIR